MKKILSVILAASMILSLTACGNSEAPVENETSTETEAAAEEIIYTDSIPLGGNAGELPISEAPFGDYKEMPVEDVYDNTDFDEAHVYVDTECDMPYIGVYRWAQNGQTLEDAIKEEAELYSDGYYKIVDSGDWGYGTGDEAGYFFACNSDDYSFYSFEIVEDGDDFVEIIFDIKTEEIELGDTGKCINVPTGYTNLNTADDEAMGLILYGTYDENYYLPDVWISKHEDTYEWLSWLWSYHYPDGIPYTEEEYNADKDYYFEWGEEEDAAYFERFGEELIYRYQTSKNGVDVILYSLKCEELDDVATNIFLVIDGEMYEIWTMTDDADYLPYIGTSIINSIHSVGGSIDISLGGNCGDISFSGRAYGEYEEIQPEGWFVYPEAKETHVYADTSCDIPYILTYRIDKAGKTLEEYTEEEMEFYEAERYVMTDSDKYEYVPSDQIGYICCPYIIDGEYYYLDVFNFEDGDDFVQLVWACKSQEVVLGDSGKAIYVPIGESTFLSGDDLAHNGYFYGVYDDSYHKPLIWVGKADFSYEGQSWIWQVDYPDGLPFTKEQFDEVSGELPYSILDSNGAYEKYYEMFGYETVKLNEISKDDIIISLSVIQSEEFNEKCANMVLEINGEVYEIWEAIEISDDAPYLSQGIINSIHDVE